MFGKAVLGKPYMLEKNFLYMKCLADRLVSDEQNQKMFPPYLDGCIG